MLAGLSTSQRAAVTSESAPLCVLASAGAGKTRVLTRRIAYRARRGTGDPTHTVAVTFTRKAAGELQHRLRQLGLREQVAAGTFHSLASAQLHRWWSDRGQQPPVLLERKGRLLAPLAAARRGLAHASVADLAGTSSGPEPAWSRPSSSRPRSEPKGGAFRPASRRPIWPACTPATSTKSGAGA